MPEEIVLSPRLDLSAASALKSTLLENTGNDVTLDFSEVRILGALCLQVLIAAARSAAANGNTMHLSNISDRVEGQMRAVGVTPESLVRGLQ